MGDTSFADLLAQGRRGDGTALSALWSRHAPAVAAFVAGRGAEDVDAVVSDAFLAAFGRLGSFEGEEQGFRALLLTIARRRLVDESRRRSRRVPVTPWSHDDHVRAPSVEELVVEGHLDPALAEALARLTPDQRDVVLLRLVADLPIEEVATVLGRSAGTVKSLQRRGVDALRRHLERATTGAPPSPRTARPTPSLEDRA